MPREIRTIIFSEPELYGALDSFRRVRRDLLPPGTLSEIMPEKAGNITIGIEMKFGPNVRSDRFILEHEFLVEAMARFCIETNIIVPRAGSKKVYKADKEWVLEIRLKASEMAHHAVFSDTEIAATIQSGIDAVMQK